jgi:hypothetical protein
MYLNYAMIAQVDLTGADTRYHSQYMVLKTGIPINNFLIELGGSLAFSQTVKDNNTESGIGFAGDFGVSWLFPGEFNRRLSLTGKIASGRINDFCEAFVPVTTKYYGFIIKHKMSALSVFTLDYSTRLGKNLGASAGASYFVRNDLGTFSAYPVEPGSNGYFLGPELYTRAIWSPFSDLQLNFAAGAFFPSLGNVGRDESIRWKAELTVTMALY